MLKQPTFSFHHVGVAVADIESAAAFYKRAFGFEVISGPTEDPIQKVKVCFVGGVESTGPIELICPLETHSPVNGYLAKGIGAYHVCFEVADISKALAQLRQEGCKLVAEPVPAAAFEGRPIAWCFTPTRQLIELLGSAAK